MRTLLLLALIGMNAASASMDAPRASAMHRVTEWWPNGHLRKDAWYLGDVRHGEYRTWTIDGKPYEFKHYAFGRESGRQQAWDDDGQLYLNYDVRNGRRYGLINAKPCAGAAADGTSAVGPGGAR